MLLVIDIGNTSTGIVVFNDDKPVFEYHAKTYIDSTCDEITANLKGQILANNIEISSIDGAIISSVVPAKTNVWKIACNELFNVEPLIVSISLKSKLKIDVDNPNEIGSDLLCDMVAALDKYGPSTLVIDMGTATKYLLIDNKSTFTGACFTPGMKLSFKALTDGTALLPKFEFTKPNKVLGKNTKDCMNSGIVLGTVLQVKALADEIEKEVGYPLNKIITGGYGMKLKEMFPDYHIEENLVFEGLRLIYQANK